MVIIKKSGYKDVSDPIFITYANADLKKHPDIFQQLFSDFKKDVTVFPSDEEAILKIIKYFIICAKIDNVEKAIDQMNEIREKEYPLEGLTPLELSIPFDGVYGNRNPWTHNLKRSHRCIYYKTINSLEGLNPDKVFNKPDLRCYECLQLIFRHMLDMIIAGVPLFRLDFYGLLFHFVNDYFRSNFMLVGEGRSYPNRQSLHERVIFRPEINTGIVSGVYAFSGLFPFSIIQFSLLKLIKDKTKGPRKIKRCPYCNDFFEAKNIQRSYCYKLAECRKKFEREKKRKQREKNAAKYY